MGNWYKQLQSLFFIKKMSSSSEYNITERGDRLDVDAWHHGDVKSVASGILLGCNPQNLLFPTRDRDPSEIKNIALSWTKVDKSFVEAMSKQKIQFETFRLYDCDIDFDVLLLVLYKLPICDAVNVDLHRVHVSVPGDYENNTQYLKKIIAGRFPNSEVKCEFDVLSGDVLLDFSSAKDKLIKFVINCEFDPKNIFNSVDNFKVIPKNKRARVE